MGGCRKATALFNARIGAVKSICLASKAQPLNLMKVEAALSHCSSPSALHHDETRLCIFLPFSISFIANIARKRPELNRNTTKVIHNLCEHLMALHTRIRWYENRLKLVAKEDARVRLLRTIPGVGVVTASAIIASIGDGHQFSNGREFAAWLGLTPANKSSGGKEKLGRITTLSGHCCAMPCRAVNG